MSSDKKDKHASQGPSGAGRSPRQGSPGGPGANQPLAETEPTAGQAGVPVWFFVVFGILFYWGQLFLDNQAGGFHPEVYGPYASYKAVSDANPKSGPEMLIARGEAVYANCAGCHQANGQGSPGQFPPLAGSEWVTEPNPARLIRIPLHGLTGPITVKGQLWNTPAPMAPLGTALSDEDIAAVLSYIRQAWGNTAPPVLPEQVKAVKEETAGRAMDGSAYWTEKELLEKVPVTP